MRGITVIFSSQGNVLRIQPCLLPFFQVTLIYNDMVVLLALLAESEPDQAGGLVSRPSIHRIAHLLGFSVQTTRACLVRLEQAGWIKTEILPNRQRLYHLNAGPQDNPDAFIQYCSEGEP